MTETAWRWIDRALPPELREGDPERHAHGRLLAAFSALCTLAGLGMTPFDLLLGTTGLAVSIAVLFFGLLLLALLRLTGSLTLVAGLLVLAVAFIGGGLSVLLREPGDPYLAWLILLGVTPLVSPSIPFTVTAALVALTLALVSGSVPRPEPSLLPLGDVLFMILTIWIAMLLILDIHRRAIASLGARIAAEREVARDLDAATAKLSAEAETTLSFLTTLRHELRTPLNGLLGLTELIAQTPTPVAVEADLCALHAAGRSMLRVLDTLLALSRATASGPPPFEAVDLPGVIDATVDATTHGFYLDPPTAALRFSPETPRVVRCDRQVLTLTVAQVLGTFFDAGRQDVTCATHFAGERLTLHFTAPASSAGTALPEGRVPLELGLVLAGELVAAHGGQLQANVDATPLSVTAVLPAEIAPGPEAL